MKFRVEPLTFRVQISPAAFVPSSTLGIKPPFLTPMAGYPLGACRVELAMDRRLDADDPFHLLFRAEPVQHSFQRLGRPGIDTPIRQHPQHCPFAAAAHPAKD